MSREEDLVRSTTRAIASAVREVPPLRLEAAADQLGSEARAVRGRGAANHDGAGRTRSWRSWLVPATVAVGVVAIAIALAGVRSVTNDSVVNRPPAASANPASPSGVPAYYVALTRATVDAKGDHHNGILVGETQTGKTLKTFPSPAHTVFASVTGAADDRTFVVFAITNSTESQLTPSTGSWYEVRIVPGTADPVRLTRIPIAPQAVVPDASPVLGFSSVLSGSGRELAVTDAETSRFAVKVFSVATGRLLHDWTTDDQSYDSQPSLAWINGDRDLILISHQLPLPAQPGVDAAGLTMRAWPVKGPASGDLTAVSKIIREIPMNKPQTILQRCTAGAGTPLVSADGETFSCATGSISAGTTTPDERLSFRTYQLASTSATAKGVIDYQVTYTKERSFYRPTVLWTSASGDILIGDIAASALSPGAPSGQRVGVISHGSFTPLSLPASITATTVTGIAF